MAEIEDQGWSLNPGRYVGVALGEAVSDEDFNTQLGTLNEELEALNAKARDLEQTVAANVATLFGVMKVAIWRDCKLGDLLDVKHGFAFLGEHFSDSGTHVVLTPGNFFDQGGFKHKHGKEKWYRGPVPATTMC